MVNKKKPTGPPQPPKKEVLYVELPADLKRRLKRLAELPHRARKITAEAIIAIRRYIEEEEAKEGLGPLEE
jgi:predicted transcriptional regulator